WPRGRTVGRTPPDRPSPAPGHTPPASSGNARPCRPSDCPIRRSHACRLGDRSLVDLACGADPGLQRSLDPRVIQRAMLAREQDSSLRPDDVRLERSLLTGRKQRERSPRPSVAVPGVRGANLVHLADPGMDPGHVIERLLEARLLVHGTPLERVLAPGV